jgi:hypothetical protein
MLRKCLLTLRNFLFIRLFSFIISNSQIKKSQDNTFIFLVHILNNFKLFKKVNIFEQSQETFAQRSRKKEHFAKLVNDVDVAQSQETFAQRSRKKEHFAKLGISIMEKSTKTSWDPLSGSNCK